MIADIAFFEAFTTERQQITEQLPPTINPVFYQETIQEAGASTLPAKFISVRTQSVIPDGWKPELDAVLTRSQGFDHIHRMFTDCVKPVALGYLGPYCSRAVAEHALMLLLMLIKNAKAQLGQFPRFYREGLTGREVFRRKVLIFGVGQIGTETAMLCRACGMDVRGVDIDPKWDGIQYVSLDEGLPWAEVVICAAALTEITAGLLNRERLASLTTGALFINVSRGEISPMEDLVGLIDEKRLGGVGLDVFPDEKDLGEKMRSGDIDDPLVRQVTAFAGRPNVICTPHNAFNSAEALALKTSRTVESVAVFYESGRFPYPVPQIKA
ncbi:MAG: hydroxyacid dehydrogenase [Candidatus Omnitrophica bacterium]|nr:hydroxyacid dehydrogenase [Candidatus Omnitrophota bacterium]MCB9719553.1 hydroxyacid dehydrogenase [Candidatus Omnitrophota bacterium]